MTPRRPRVELYDTTLRDGAQAPGLSYSVEDRMRILHKLDQLGVPYIEGGWPARTRATPSSSASRRRNDSGPRSSSRSA